MIMPASGPMKMNNGEPRPIKSQRKPINNQQETDSSNKNNEYIDKKIHLGGCIVYEQCRVILPCSFKFIDCMALAKEENLPAITHFVLDEFYSRDLIFTGFVIKVVFSGTNEAEAPRLKDLRAIALA